MTAMPSSAYASTLTEVVKQLFLLLELFQPGNYATHCQCRTLHAPNRPNVAGIPSLHQYVGTPGTFHFKGLKNDGKNSEISVLMLSHLRLSGLWPEYSLLNHACAPNALAVVVGDVLILRAMAAIPKGVEVTTSYLTEPEAQSPAGARRLALEKRYGFSCGCKR